MKIHRWPLLTLLSAAILFAPHLYGASHRSDALGKVSDPTGSVVPGAKIDLLRVAAGTHREATSNESGSYTIPNLASGTYTVTVSAPSFGTEVIKGLNLEVGQNAEQNFTLKPGSVSEQVDITATPAALDLASSQISDVITGTTLRQLPLNTRDWTLLATLQPGVSQVRTEKAVAVGADRGNRGFPAHS